MTDPYRLVVDQGPIPAGSTRIRDMARVLAGSRITTQGYGRFERDDAEATIRALETAARDGTIYDAPTLMLGLQQRPRHVNGRDEAHLLAETIAGAALTSEAGTRGIRICNHQTDCDHTPFTREEIGAVISEQRPISPRMNPQRAITVGTGGSAVMSYIATTRRPELVTGNDRSPAEVLAQDRRNQPGVDVVAANREAVRACIIQDIQPATGDTPGLDLQNCARLGARAAIYNIALNGIRFQEVNPMDLDRVPDVPNARPRSLSARSPAGLEQQLMGL